MIVTAPLPTIEIEKALPPIATGSAASELATGFLRYASACWRGDTCAAAFPLRLSAYWRPVLPPPPAAAPDAVSLHGAAGRGIRWYQEGQDVLGYVPGLGGGYQVPAQAVAQLVRCAPAA
jgi:hypothetical protein